LNRYDPGRDEPDAVAQLPGYTRGMDCFAGHAFVGLSRIRESSVFGGLLIAEQREKLCCGVAVVDLASGQNIVSLRFLSGVVSRRTLRGGTGGGV
jgi:uncharacterized protein (TIGR03032 family)